MASESPITQLLDALSREEPGSIDELFVSVYGELRRLARAVRRGRADARLNTTAFVHETDDPAPPAGSDQ